MIDEATMGTHTEAKALLMEKTRAWRDLRQPLMANRAAHRERDAQESQARFELANAALLWLWHEEEAAKQEPPHPADRLYEAYRDLSSEMGG